jgi:dTDP-4-dehydrorhamnose reductase
MSMDINSSNCKPELWAGMECTINRVGDTFRDQLDYTGHYSRSDDLARLAGLNIKAIRYPLLWERFQPEVTTKINFDRPRRDIDFLNASGIEPIVGLLHHGSGPRFTDLLDPKFATKFCAYAEEVIKAFPGVKFFTPINEPLTTARFSGLYGLWYPHHTKPLSFAKALLNQMKGVVLAMKAIREINPEAKLIQTEDLGKTHSTPLLQYQADFENERRWLTFDLLCGRVSEDHPMWKYFTSIGIREEDLEFFLENRCEPDILGLNYYVTSERFLNENVESFPNYAIGGNEQHRYVDTEAVRAQTCSGLKKLMTEAWERFQIPMAITEAHLACTREEQMRWFQEIWKTACELRSAIPVKAVTAWTTFGAFDWNSLLTTEAGHYESGAFDIRQGVRPTALAKMIKTLGSGADFKHPILQRHGWWAPEAKQEQVTHLLKQEQPVLIIGKFGTLANAFSKICTVRNIGHVALSRSECDVTNENELRRTIDLYKPWAIVNTSGYVDVDAAEQNPAQCLQLNAVGPANLARVCREKGIHLMTFSSDLVFNGSKQQPYHEEDLTQPLNCYGRSKEQGDSAVSKENSDALIIRTSAFFGPWDKYNFAFHVLSALNERRECHVVDDVIISPTYVPHLVNAALDLFIDEESGIWHVANDGAISWAAFAAELANRKGFTRKNLINRKLSDMNWRAARPQFSALTSGKGIALPSLDRAIGEYISHTSF